MIVGLHDVYKKVKVAWAIVVFRNKELAILKVEHFNLEPAE